MKIRRVFPNNRKKTFVIETSKEVYEYPYSKLITKPTSNDLVVGVHVDEELAREGFTYKLRSGKEDSILMDEVLFYSQDPELLRKLLLHNLTADALRIIKKSTASKREIARRLKTSPRHLYRLLDPSFYGKTIDQMVKLLHVLGHKVEVTTKMAA